MCTSRPPLENVTRILATSSDAMIEKPLVFAAIWIVQVTDPGRLSTAEGGTVQAVADSDPRLTEAHQD